MHILSGCDIVPKKDNIGNVTVLKVFQVFLGKLVSKTDDVLNNGRNLYLLVITRKILQTG